VGWHVTGSERTRIGRAAVVIAALVSGMTASSCGEFTHNNPFDPAVPVTLTIHGPDSAFSQFDTLRFTVTTDPVYDYDDVEWLISGLQKIDNNGTWYINVRYLNNCSPGSNSPYYPGCPIAYSHSES